MLPSLPSILMSGVESLGALIVLVTAPLCLELLLTTLGAALPGRRREDAAARSPIERLVVLVPSHNEQGSIAACVRSLALAARGTAPILVVAHNCQDRTAELAAAEGAQVAMLDDPRLAGKGHALAYGFRLAFEHHHADAVLVIDADSTVSANLIRSVRAALGHALVVQTRYASQSALNTPKGRLHALSFLCKNVVRAAGRERLNLSCGIFGNGFALRKEVLGRVPYAAHSIVEDLEFHLTLIAAGISTRLVAEAVVLAEVPASAAGQRSQSARWEGGRIQMVRAQGLRLVRQVFAGSPRLAEPLLDLLGLPIALQVFLLAVLLAMPVAAFRWYAAAGFLILAFHLGVGVRMSPDPRGTARALLQAPLYVFKKLALTPAVLLMASKRAAWVKTSRAGAEK